MQLRNVTGPVLAIGGTLVWGILETIALQRARRKTARLAAQAVPEPRPVRPAGTDAESRDPRATH